MKALTYPEFFKNIIEILKKVELGEEVIIKNDQTQENVAVLIPYENYQQKKDPISKRSPRKLGILKEKATFKIKKDFKMTDEELLNS